MEKPVPEGDQKWTSAAFRIVGDRFKPGEIDAMLGLKPTKLIQKGEPVNPRNPALTRRHSVWILNSPLGDERPHEEHLQWLLDQLEAKTGSVRLLANMYKLEFFLGFGSENGQGGFTLDNTTLARIANLGISLSVDLYPPGSIETP